MSFLDYFKVLGVSKNATNKEIKNAYRKLAKKYHPDTYIGDKTFAENKMKELNEAYDVLTDENKRRKLVEEESATVKNTNYYSSNYEEGSVYDFDKHFNRTYNQSYSYYNYTPYEDENDYTNMYYIDFAKLKRKIFKQLKNAIVGTFIVIVIVMAIAIFAIRMIYIGISDFFEAINSEISNNTNPTTVSEPNNDIILPNTDYATQQREQYQQKLEELNKAYEEWYNIEGKAYEEEWNTFLKELESELTKELEKANK